MVLISTDDTLGLVIGIAVEAALSEGVLRARNANAGVEDVAESTHRTLRIEVGMQIRTPVESRGVCS
ncbi:MAG: hypothetical protein GY938_03025 [Ketobacter sp.]|nr:hypothetical protein [Ketobacter sp.]